ncbi:MAG TPA: hypothetical protein VGD24_05855 [Gallionella sp.]
MKNSLLLFLSADRLHAQLMSRGGIVMQRDFACDTAGYEGFSAFLETCNYPTYLLVDLIEEDFRHEIVPHLSGKSRAALFKRKFEQFYRGTTFHQATLLQRLKTGRRDDDVLFSALTNPALITPWLEIMQTRQTPLAGIFSIPQISAPLIKDHPSQHLLLISWEKNSGLRQTYFSEHRLQISRLTTLHGDLGFTGAVVKELARTYQYLKSLSLLPSGQVLDVRILCHAQDVDELRNTLPNNTDMRYDFADIAAMGSQFKVAHSFTDSDATQIYLHQLLTHRPRSHYASAEHTRYFTLWQWRLAMNWGAGILLFVSLAWAIVSIWQSGGHEAETEILKVQIQRTLKEVEQITQELPPHTTAPADMKSAVEVINTLDRYQPALQTFLLPLSTAMDRFPQIHLTRLDWKRSADEPVAPDTLADVPAQVITLEADLKGFESGYRNALAYLSQFQLELGRLGYQVSVLSQPIDVSPTGSLANQRSERENALSFSLKLAWRPGS